MQKEQEAEFNLRREEVKTEYLRFMNAVNIDLNLYLTNTNNGENMLTTLNKSHNVKSIQANNPTLFFMIWCKYQLQFC